MIASGPLVALLLLTAAPAPAPEWAPVALTDNDGTTVYFVDRTSIRSDEAAVSAWTYAVGPSTAMRLHFEYDCGGKRFRFLEASLAADADPADDDASKSAWTPVAPGTPIQTMMTYACSAGKVDFGFGDLAVKAESPEAFAREFIRRRSSAK